MRVLLIGEAVTLAHVARPLALGSGLAALGIEVVLATAPSRRAWVEACGLRYAALDSISPSQFASALAQGRPVYDAATLLRYVEADRELIDAIRPHVVVGDFRLSLSVSARLARVPYAAITNAYWSPYSLVPFPLPELPISRRLPLPLALFLFRLGGPIAMRSHCRPLNAIRRLHGLSPLPPDLRAVYTDADAVLYADDPGLFPVRPVPPTHHYLGPVLWSPPVEWPIEWGDSVDPPLVYVTLGSSGSSTVLAAVLDALADEPVQVIASSAGDRAVGARGPRQHLAPYLPGEEATRRATVVVCNGGSMTTQQAMILGRPVLGIPSNMDQFMNMAPLVDAGAALSLRADRLSPAAIRSAVRHLIADVSAARAASKLGDRMRSMAPAALALKRVLDSLVR